MSTGALRKAIGPGLLLAGAAIGVSHLVQSTRAGADYGFTLVWAVVLASLTKYVFLEFGPRYAAATGESLLEGYRRLGTWALVFYVAVTVGTMFTVQAAVTLVTAGLAAQLFGLTLTPVWWSVLILAVCVGLLTAGQYPLLDGAMKLIMAVLAVSTVVAVGAALAHGRGGAPAEAPTVWTAAGVSFVIALMGWMPIPIDAAVWHSLWTLERRRQTLHTASLRESVFDFNLGYVGAAVLALGFLTLGAVIMFGRGLNFADSPSAFAGQLIDLYGQSLGRWSIPVISLAAFTTMFSTTLTVTDAYPRVLRRVTELVVVRGRIRKESTFLYFFYLFGVVSVAVLVLRFVTGTRGFKAMIDLATTLSFLTAPILAFMNYRLLTSAHTPLSARPRGWRKALSWVSLVFLVAFDLIYLYWELLR